MRYNVVPNLHMNGSWSRRNISKISIVTHSKISLLQLAKEFPFDKCTNYVICVARHKVKKCWCHALYLLHK